VIKSYFKSWLPVREMARSVPFYASLGLELAGYRADDRIDAYLPIGRYRRAGQELTEEVYATWSRAFFWIDAEHTQCIILGTPRADRPFLWQHVAFEVDLEELRRAGAWLAERGISELVADFGRPATEPIVHNWIPSASFSFRDPDGNQIELSARLPGGPIPEADLPGVEPLYLGEWERLRSRVAGEDAAI
jgi:lactoylglutathione lyase